MLRSPQHPSPFRDSESTVTSQTMCVAVATFSHTAHTDTPSDTLRQRTAKKAAHPLSHPAPPPANQTTRQPPSSQPTHAQQLVRAGRSLCCSMFQTRGTLRLHPPRHALPGLRHASPRTLPLSFPPPPPLTRTCAPSPCSLPASAAAASSSSLARQPPFLPSLPPPVLPCCLRLSPSLSLLPAPLQRLEPPL